MTVLHIVEGLLVGGLTGFLSGLLGVGGGFLLVPLLLLIGLPMHTVVGTSLAAIACVGLAGVSQHTRQGSIDFLMADTLALPAAVMASVSARFLDFLSPTSLYFLFSSLTLAVLIFFHLYSQPDSPASSRQAHTQRASEYIRHRHRVIATTCYSYDVHLLKAVLCGLATGLVSGFFGVGGGFMLVPLVVIVLRIPMQITAGSSLAVIIPSAVVGAVTHWRLGHVNLGVWIPVVVSGVLSSQLGARYVARLSPALLKQLFLALLLVATLYMLAKGVITLVS